MPMKLYNDGDFRRVVPLVVSEDPEPYRSQFRRDYARILHSPVFRRLQRKLQLFPGDESDFFRNRLTHSLEVAQVAKSIGVRLNYIIEKNGAGDIGRLDLDLIELAGFAHDLGHPPFGHTGEYALQQRMQSTGGYEGNAQTLRILSKLEKRQTKGGMGDFREFFDGADQRAGLNLCYRSLAAILKYDKCIPVIGGESICKGYYKSEEDLVKDIKKAILGPKYKRRKDDKFAVIEMQIMDLADDLAYSTYDLEDALKAGFASPLHIIQQLNDNDNIRDSVARKLFKSSAGRDYPLAPAQASEGDRASFEDIQSKMLQYILEMLSEYFGIIDSDFTKEDRKRFASKNLEERKTIIASIAVLTQKYSNEISCNGYVRAQLTSDLVGSRLRKIGIDIDEEVPALSKIVVPEDVRFEIDVLKHLTFELHVKSPRLKLLEYRGKQIVRELFDCFDADEDGDLLPHDWRSRIAAVKGFSEEKELRKRIVCDFVAGMTDSYAVDMYNRLKTTNPSALFRPF